jgi:hypothetical protein
MPGPLGTPRATLQRRIRLLVGATITYNVIEAVVALAEGTRVSSSALIGFGLDSVVEISSAAAVAWQFSAKDPETREKAALRFIALSFSRSPHTSPSTRCSRFSATARCGRR